MPIYTTTAEELDAQFAQLGLAKGMHVAVHSRLISFGRIEGGVATVYEALRRAVGWEGTILVPTYTLRLGPESPFDYLTTPPQQMGQLSEYVWKMPESKRSRSPMHSHAAIGQHADNLLKSKADCSFGEGSDFNVMHKAGFFLLLLGISFTVGASFVHQVETEVGVPYRSWLNLPRRVNERDGTIRDIVYRYYGRELNSPWKEDFSRVEREMLSSGVAKSAKAPYGYSHLMTLENLYNCVYRLLRQDPCAVVKYSPHVN